MKLAVAGTGYVGLVTGVCLAHVGHNVICVDIDEEKVNTMKSGVSPIYEPGLEELMKESYNDGKLDFTTDFVSAYKDADVIFIGVGTPEREDGSANLDYVFGVAKQIAESIEQDCLIVVKSTVPIGTNDRVEGHIKKHLKHDVNVEVASNPEFLAQGSAVKDTLEASRIVIGVESNNAEQILKKVYTPFNQPIVSTNRRSAEMVKYASNDFLALKISFMNDIANLCELVGANIEDVAEGMSFDPRIGNKFLNAGIGYGGSCFPKDTKALHWLASEHGYELKTVKAAIEVNEIQRFKLLKKARDYFETMNGVNVAVLGLTFKPGTDDLREAPSLPNVKALIEEGANVKAYDPVGVDNFKKYYPTEIDYTDTPQEALKGADICLIFTEWGEIKELSPSSFKELMKTPLVLDGRNCYRPEDMKDINYYSVGR
ncbi:UDP-glucose dehydrogenase family protein [Haloplasma contractile]|uniref:UDP-glucose 6-dehydrogenase n=1 Tax=Haloplasma contractile SSD-17B TaxID=1033810 RepID=U2FIK7_9MOLU|nr:UDP-glucose/GDP-mannose dehydrogenase family protein [Haloplasma contractile]ERJ11064.1 UDPglucose 6-dehydrogenase protein [Haloplasma contractile SSD-17B]